MKTQFRPCSDLRLVKTVLDTTDEAFANRNSADFTAKSGKEYHIMGAYKYGHWVIYVVLPRKNKHLDEPDFNGTIHLVIPKEIKKIAWAAINEHPSHVDSSVYFSLYDNSTSIKVQKAYKRQGIATAMMDYAEKITGKKFHPSEVESPEMKDFSKDRMQSESLAKMARNILNK
jgi:GNAT superfamily N-acetyltransferase